MCFSFILPQLKYKKLLTIYNKIKKNNKKLLTNKQHKFSMKSVVDKNATRKEYMKRSIKSIRVDLNLTQKEMAEKMGVGVQTWRNKELYITELTATELMALCSMAKVNPYDVKLTK